MIYNQIDFPTYSNWTNKHLHGNIWLYKDITSLDSICQQRTNLGQLKFNWLVVERTSLLRVPQDESVIRDNSVYHTTSRNTRNFNYGMLYVFALMDTWVGCASSKQLKHNSPVATQQTLKNPLPDRHTSSTSQSLERTFHAWLNRNTAELYSSSKQQQQQVIVIRSRCCVFVSSREVL